MMPSIVITCGDVNGIGLRCLAGALRQAPYNNASFVLLISRDVLRQAIDTYALGGTIEDDHWNVGENNVRIVELGIPTVLRPGAPHDDAARLAVAALETACSETVAGRYQAMVTLPISKHALDRVGWTYPGQTEMIAAYAVGEPLMVLCTPRLHVALASVHIPIRDVAQSLTTNGIVGRLRQLYQHLRGRIGIAEPRIAVLGLNPHAGENGRIGHEENLVIRPAIELAQTEGIAATGPFPADGFFAFGAYERFDGVLAMYHDQGLIPLKLLAKGAGVNVTAGLSVIRTSPDHGTAYDRIHSPDIDSASTKLAIEMAIEMANRPHAVT